MRDIDHMIDGDSAALAGEVRLYKGAADDADIILEFCTDAPMSHARFRMPNQDAVRLASAILRASSETYPNRPLTIQ